MSGKVSGLSIFYATAGGVLLWSGFKGQTTAQTVNAIMHGDAAALTKAGTQTVGSPALSVAPPATSGTGSAATGTGSAATGTGSSSGPIPASSGGTILFSQVKSYWVLAGGPSGVSDIAAAIAEAESGLRPGAVQQGQPYATTGWGLWQITPGNSEPQIGTDKALLNPLTNARAAVAKYKQAGNSFGPWTTYTSGKYANYMPASALTGRGGIFG